MQMPDWSELIGKKEEKKVKEEVKATEKVAEAGQVPTPGPTAENTDTVKTNTNEFAYD